MNYQECQTWFDRSLFRMNFPSKREFVFVSKIFHPIFFIFLA